MKFLKHILTSLFLVVSFLLVSSKDKKGVIMTVDGEEVPTSEFLYLFQKNNQQQSQPQTLDEYLQLFEIYRLKVADAKRAGIDTVASFRKEIDGYRRELLEPYIADTIYIQTLIETAVERERDQVESSHIMFIRTNDEEKDKRSLELLDSIRTALLNGSDFKEMAKTYSQDKFSSERGGYLGFTPAGTFPYGFETAVYETPEGEISEIVESHVGWHIVKAGSRHPAMDMDHPAKSYEEIKNEVERKITSPVDVRYHQLRGRVVNNLKNKHPEIDTEGLSEEEAYNKLIEAEEDSQYAENPDYRNLVDEYINGSLLYEVSVENVWNKASNDVEGLENFFVQNRDRYKWEKPHAKGILVQATNDSVASIIKSTSVTLASDSIVPYIRKNHRKEATAEKFNVTEGKNPMIDHLLFGGEEAKPQSKNFKTYFIIEGRIVESPENVDDVRTAVVNDYQDYLERNWVADLRNQHSIVINKKELSGLRKKIKK